jgi:hypothetical protein
MYPADSERRTGMAIKSKATHGVTLKTFNVSYGNPGTPRLVTPLDTVQRVHTWGHLGWKTANGKRDVGGPFSSAKLKVDYHGHHWESRYNYSPTLGWQNHFVGFLTPSPEVAGLHLENNLLSTDNQISAWLESRVPQGLPVHELQAFGTKAINAVKPTNPSVDVATTLAELMAERRMFSLPSRQGGVSGNYLNYQFGIDPTVGFIKDFRKTIEEKDKILAQYRRDAMKIIRREYHFPDSRTSSKTISTGRPVAPMGVNLGSTSQSFGTLTKITSTHQKIWFAGAFRYSIPKDAFPKSIQELDRLYGVRPGISTAWELLPFSWLVDYFTPIGGLLSNIDSFLQDGLVLPYAYAMCTTTVVDEYTWTGGVRNADGIMVGRDVGARVVKTRLQRISASPFGFGLLPGDLSLEQQSILAALAMSYR